MTLEAFSNLGDSMILYYIYVLYLYILQFQEETPSTKEEKFSSIHKPVAIGSHQLLTVGTTLISKLTDDQLIKEFLSGSYCFHGVRNKS